MIAKLFSYWKKSKEQQIVDCALKLEKLLNEIGREPAKNGAASSIHLYEFSHRDLHHLSFEEKGQQRIIKFNQKGEIIK